MKKLISILSVGILLFAACQTEEYDTNQYSNTAVKLVSFGPNPVMRGATLCFYGSNLDKIVSVEVPGVDPITDIEVITSGNPSEIRIQLPADGTTEGVVTLTASNGTVLTTQSELTYTEPIVFTEFSTDSAMPGDEITITGDYMNLLTAVIFADEVTVAVNKGATRYKATVTVPANAITGEPILTDGSNLIYTFSEITIGDPTVSSLTVSDPRPGKTAVVSGKYLNMIESLTFTGDVQLDTAAFTLNDDYTTLTVTIPSTAQSGDVVVTDYAGKDFTAGSLTMTAPSNLAVSPSPVKAGATLTISGDDLDLVTAVNFSGASGASFTYSDGDLAVTVPAAAKEGDVTLVMANGESASVAFTLVHPTVTAIDPLALTAGETITVTGTDLDLITGVTLGGKTEEFTVDSETAITITTATTSVSGKIVLSLANGETVEPDDAITMSYDSYIVITEMPAAEHIGATVTFKGSNFMMIDRIYIGEAKVIQYVTRTDEEISFIMPYNSVGTYNITFELLSGDKEVYPTPIEVLLEIEYITAWEGSLQIGWGDGTRVLVPASKFEGVSAGSVMRLYYTQVDQQWDQAQFNYGDWSGINFDDASATTFNQYLVPTDVYGWFSDGILDRCTEVILTSEILANIAAKKGDCEDVSNCGIIIQGSGLTFTKIEILSEISQEITVWEDDPVDLGSWSINWEMKPASMFVDAGLTAGQTLYIYVTATADWWQIQFFDGHWAGMDIGMGNGNNINAGIYTITEDRIAIPVTADVAEKYTTLTDWGHCGILQGENLIINKITIL